YRDFVTEQVMNCIQHGTPFDFEVPLITAKGNLCWVRAIGKPEYKEGKCVRIYGSYQDIHERKIAELRLQNTADNIPGALFQFILKPDGSDELLNLTKGSLELWGMEPEECMADTSKVWKQIKDGGDYDKIIESIQMSALTLKHWFCQWRSLRPDGKLRWHEGNGKPQKLTDGSVLWDSIITDITDKKLAESELRELNLELAEHTRLLAISNADLEQFAYVASHDLQEPLRMVTSFLAKLEKNYGQDLDDKAKQYIHFAVDGAHRMRQIILDLLDYSRVGSKKEELTTINLNDLVQEAWQLNTALVDKLKAKIEYDSLPTVLAQLTPLKQIFQNLISNAIKYSKKDIPPVVTIQANDQPDEWVISVRDNGIGIEPNYYDKIFVIFQRLHSNKEHEGTGIGLAVVKKIVENHGGKIWVDSTPNKGSTFYFTIKK
ncbi:MAG TPA: PAS domain-containing sensor histidine kinase, partial [Bacteroidetes bacterium]|nr:PAS domain-containing sensor histidine kinase [Bacteroidota bacterium]